MIIRPLLVAAARTMAAACDRPQEPSAPQSGASSGGASSGGATTRTTPADITPPASPADKAEGRNPQQGQVDPKQSAQHKDFQQPGDARGPDSPSVQPKPN
jgi:hypothetical protein